MVGPLIYGFSEDAVAAAKVMADFAKTNDKLVIKAGAYRRQGAGRQWREAAGQHPSRRKCCWRSCCGLMHVADLAHRRRAGARWRRRRATAPQLRRAAAKPRGCLSRSRTSQSTN